MTKTLAFLHTSPVHVATFDHLLAEIAPGVAARHLVDETLLDEARAAGAITPALARRIADALREASAPDGALVLCTCSTIGGSAEAAGGWVWRPRSRSATMSRAMLRMIYNSL